MEYLYKHRVSKYCPLPTPTVVKNLLWHMLLGYWQARYGTAEGIEPPPPFVIRPPNRDFRG